MALLDDVRVACRVVTTTFDDELSDLIQAGFADIGITDVRKSLLTEATCPPLIKRAILTYCKMNFGVLEDSVYDRFKASYDEQKAQLLMSLDYNDLGGDSDV